MNITILKKIGLSDKEITVYLKLLEYGIVSGRKLAEISDLNRGTIYDILKQLQERGLVSYFHKDTKKKFVAENPEKLLKLLEEEKRQIDNSRQGINEIIPELKALQEKGGDAPITKYYEGDKGIRIILEDLLGVKNLQEYYVYSAKEVSDDINKAYPGFTKDRIKKNIKVKAISLATGGGVSGLDERRWLGTDNQTATFIIIYNNKCAFISRDAKGTPVGVLIENQMIYETQKLIFLKLWELLA